MCLVVLVMMVDFIKGMYFNDYVVCDGVFIDLGYGWL